GCRTGGRGRRGGARGTGPAPGPGPPRAEPMGGSAAAEEGGGRARPPPGTRVIPLLRHVVPGPDRPPRPLGRRRGPRIARPPPRSRPLPAGPGLAGSPRRLPGAVRASARRDPAVFPKDRRNRGKGGRPGPVGGPARRRARSRRPRDHRGERVRIARTPPPRAPV